MSFSNRKLFEYLIAKKAVKYLPFILFALVVSAVTGYFIPKLIHTLFELYNDKEKYFSHLYLMSAVFFIMYVNRVIYGLLINKYIQYLIEEIRHYCYSIWLLSSEQYKSSDKQESDSKKFPLGEVIARIMNDTESTRELVTSGTFGIFIDFFFILSCLISFLQIHFRSGLIIVLAEFLACAFLIYGSRYMFKVFLSVRKSNGIMAKTVANVTSGMGQSYYLNHGNYASKRGKIAFVDFLKKQLRANIWDASYYSVAESFYPLFLILLAATIPITQIKEVAIIAAIIDLLQRSINPIKDITSKIANIQRSFSGLIRVQEFTSSLLKNVSETVVDSSPLISFLKLEVDIKSFQYFSSLESRPVDFVLSDIFFTAKRGELVGIVGMSGSGKSTLLKILAAEIVPDNGRVTLFDSDGKRYMFPAGDSSGHYKRQLSLVSQDSHVFTHTFFFNICLTDDDEKVYSFWESIKAQLPYLTKWGVSLDSHLNPEHLSSGQKQLVSAVRALYLKRPVVLFDEIASGLDSELEESLRNAVMLAQKHSLTIIVAHRPETVLKADQIIVMKEGKIKAIGKHQYLIENDKTYSSFIKEISS